MYLSSISSRLLLYDVHSWDLKKCYGSYDSIIRDVSWSDEGKYMLQVSPKGLVEILSAADEIRSLQHVPFRDTWCATFHRDGHRNVAIGTKSGNVIIWDTKNKSIIKSFPSPSHLSSVNLLSYNVKNTSLAATMQNGDTIIYGLASNIPVLTVKHAASKSISAMKFHNESRSLLGLAADEGHVILRDISTNKDKAFFENVHASPISDFTFSQVNKDVMLSSGLDKVMHVYDIRLQNVVSSLSTSYTLSSVAINVENQVALGTKNGFILVYDLRDMSSPLKTLRGHKEEVKRVIFQPSRKKSLSADISLREDSEVHTPVQRVVSPIKKRVSDMFVVNDSPPKKDSDSPVYNDNTPDSFLVVMGLDKTNNDIEDEFNRACQHFEKKNDINSFRLYQDTEKSFNKVSTPVNGSIAADNFVLPSPICPLNVTDTSDNNIQNAEEANSHTKQITDTPITLTNIDSRTSEEIKDLIKSSCYDMAVDNKTYFCCTMMALTKQNLYLKKQLATVTEQLQVMTQNQTALMESVRALTLEVDKLKMGLTK